jgi:hypothetical protein
MSTRPKPLAFVLMPFDQSFSDTYQLAIKPACEAAGAYAERVDEQNFQGSILERIYNQISKADLVVADMTGKNANVFYEVGYAHALGKSTILLTKDAADIPFDLKHFPHIVYSAGLTELKQKLEAAARWHLQNPLKTEETTADVHIRLNGTPIDEPCEVEVPAAASGFGFSLTLEIENRVSRTIANLECKVGFIVPLVFDAFETNDKYQNTTVKLDDSQQLFLASNPINLLPGAWAVRQFTAWTHGSSTAAGATIPFTVRLFRESGVRDFPVVLKFVADDA